MSAVLLLALVSVSTTVGAEEITREARIEATIPQSGNVMGVGFNSVWMMDLTTKKLVRINPGDNSVTEIPIAGVGSEFSGAGMAVGEAAIWLPDTDRSMIYKIDPSPNRVAKEIAIDPVGAVGIPMRSGIAAGEGAVWAISSNDELRRYSAGGGSRKRRFPCHPAVRA
jgi:hypothetical protein